MVTRVVFVQTTPEFVMTPELSYGNQANDTTSRLGKSFHTVYPLF